MAICINCNKELKLKEPIIYFSMRKKNEKSVYSCEECWNKNQTQYINDYHRITQIDFRDEENSAEWIKFIKVECKKCGDSFLCEGELSKKHEWVEGRDNRCVNYDYEKNKVINNFENNKSNSQEVKPKNGERISGGIIALISLLVLSILGVIGYLIWKKSKN